MYHTLAELDDAVIDCRACPRLVAWREQVAREKKPEFQDETYWGRPVPGFGPADARAHPGYHQWVLDSTQER